MQYQPEQLNLMKAWIVGSKLKIEKVFHCQIVEKEKLKDKLHVYYLEHYKELDFYIQEIELPVNVKEEYQEKE